MKKANELFNTILEKNAHFQKAISYMNKESIEMIKVDFQKIIELKEQLENELEFYNIAVQEGDTEGELYYQERYNNIEDEIKYQKVCINDYINSVLRNNEK